MYNDPFVGRGGAVDSHEDNRNVYHHEVAGAVEKPDEMFSPYTVAAIMQNGVNTQGVTSSCVAQSTDKGQESIQLWTKISPSRSDIIQNIFEVDADYDVKGIRGEVRDMLKDFSPRFIYALAKKFDNISTGGTHMYMGASILRRFGSAEESVYPSDHNLGEKKYRDASLIPQTAYNNATDYKVVRYAFVEKNMEAHKIAVATAPGNGYIVGYPLGGNMTQPQTPPKKENQLSGHANWAFGYDKDYIYAIGSWGEDYGLTLYLRVIDHHKFGPTIIRGTKDNHSIKIRGVHQIGKEWFASPRTIYRGVTIFDDKFSDPNLEKRIKMLKVVRDAQDRIYVIFKGKRYWISPYDMYRDGRGELWPDIEANQVAFISNDELNKYPRGGIWGDADVVQYFKYQLGLL